MEESALNTLPLNQYGGSVIGCACGRTHVIKTADFAFGNGTLDALVKVASDFAPAGSHVLVLTDTATDALAAERAVRLLARAGYRPVKQVLEGAVQCSETYLGGIAVPEDTKLLIGAGGGTVADITKVLGTLNRLPTVLIAVDPSTCTYLAGTVNYYKNGLAEPYTCNVPSGIVCDTNLLDGCTDRHNASGFGDIVSKLIALFDWRVAALLEDEPFCPYIEEQVLAVIDAAVEKLDQNFYSKQEISALLLEYNIRLSALIQMLKNGRLTGGGESQVSQCVDLLFRAEKRTSKLQGENEFILSTILAKVYTAALEHLDQMEFVPPPDQNMRQETASKYLGISELVLSQKMHRTDPKRLKLYDYKLKEYREELLVLIRHYDKKLTKAMKIFKRLYNDCGYSLIGYLDRADVSLCIGLGPDIRERFTMLTQMKNMGLLDRYIV